VCLRGGMIFLGQLGDGGESNSNVPKKIAGLSNVVQISAGDYHALALLGNGIVYVWGFNNAGQLGNGMTSNQESVPVQVSLPPVTQIAAGDLFSLVLLTNQSVMGWGSNGNGQLGDNTTKTRPTPQLVPGLFNVTQVAAGAGYSLVLINDGTVRSFGSNLYSQLGDGTLNDRWYPVQVPGLANVLQISCGESTSFAILQSPIQTTQQQTTQQQTTALQTTQQQTTSQQTTQQQTTQQQTTQQQTTEQQTQTTQMQFQTTHQQPANPIIQGNSRSSNAALIGGVVGGIGGAILLVLLLILVLFVSKKRGQQKEESTKKLELVAKELEGIQIQEKVREGITGEVYKGTWSGAAVFLKKLKDAEVTQSFFLEFEKFSKLKHPNIIRIFGIWRKDEETYIVTEHVGMGELINILKKEQLSLTEKLHIFQQLTGGMIYISQNHIIHRNLTLGSVLGTRDAGTLLVKVSDFELAITEEQVANGKQTLSPFLIRWAAPEVLLSNKFSTKSDVWALGITFWEVLADGTEPYEGLSNEEVVKQVTEYGFMLKQPEKCSDSLYGILKDMWKKQANDRPTFEDIKNRLRRSEKVVE